MSLKLAVFDVDGTLVDSRRTIHEAAVHAALALGLPEPQYEAVRQIVGLTLHEALRQLAPEITDAELAEFVAGFQGWFQARHADPGFVEPLYDGAPELLTRLKRDGWLIAMATGNSRRGVNRLLASHGWADLFDTTHCADDGPGKPHPAMLQGAMRAVGAPPERTVMIGDTGWDIRMALAADVRAQGVAWGFHTAEEIAAAGAHHVANDFAELDEQLDSFAASL
ncbi:MAG TPA: HAD-IA family hydrolase [Caulobacteraceae bacterium]|nr:HAD-IA family hydrolase [Caulobacteraceae bacterium]